MAEALRWGILGPGSIAKAFAKGLSDAKAGTLAAVGSRDKGKAEQFGADYGVEADHCHGSYEALLADAAVDAVYIATPHPMHPEWTIKAAEAGKHVLCEKPLALNHAQGEAMIEAAREQGVFLMEAFMYRCHPQTAKLVELIREGAIGRVCVIEATFSFQAPANPESRLMNPALGGGGILDVGCYPVSISRLIAGAAQGKPFADPVKVKGAGHLGETGVDEYARALLQFEGDIVASCATGVRLNQGGGVQVFGDAGSITLANPWAAGREKASDCRIIVQRQGEEAQTIDVPSERTSFSYEADVVAEAVAAGKQEAVSPAMSWGDSLGNLRALDAWRQEIGLAYPQERFHKTRTMLNGRPLGPRQQHNMEYGEVPGLDKPVSKLVMGGISARNFAEASILWDAWIERGGNAFDTAYIYGGGKVDRLIGEWQDSRDARDEIVILGKGAHSPHCDPASITRQLHESLERLRTDHLDIYVMHRDNLDVPVGEFIDVLNEHLEAGRFKAFGGSNWSIDRIQQANAYAEKHGKRGFDVLNNNLSLARMVEPVWGGCIHASDPESRAYLERTQMVHMAWSSQARGFFTERAERELASPGFDPELRRCWISDDNLERRRRAIELAEKKGVRPINIAAAYVIRQPFPSFALIGPQNLRELVTSLPALDVQLTREELKWLNLEA